MRKLNRTNFRIYYISIEMTNISDEYKIIIDELSSLSTNLPFIHISLCN